MGTYYTSYLRSNTSAVHRHLGRDQKTCTMALATLERDLLVHLSNETTPVVYTLRGLTEEEVPSWAKFCASVFSYKECPPPEQYFAAHYYNDPDRKASFIRGVFLDKKELVASCRIFCRHVSGGPHFKGERVGVIRAGGIGEVCTAENHRRRGLSRALLQDAIRIMESDGMEVSLLHSAPTFYPVYQKLGYVGTLSQWSVAKIHCQRLLEASVSFGVNSSIREARFPSDTPQLMTLHQRFSEKEFAGCIIRSLAYWNDYLSRELSGSLWLLTETKGHDETVLGWLSVRYRGEKLQLREFGCNRNCAVVANVLSALLGHATTRETLPQGESFQLLIPTFVVDMLAQQKETADFVQWEEGIESANDGGWMYLNLRSDGGVSLPEISKTCLHFIWPADSF